MTKPHVLTLSDFNKQFVNLRGTATFKVGTSVVLMQEGIYMQ